MKPESWPARLLVIDVEGNGASPPDLVEVAALPIRHGARTPPPPGPGSSARPYR